MGDTSMIIEQNGKEQKAERVFPTKAWLESQIATCQRTIDQNIGAISLCRLMLRDGVFVDEKTEQTAIQS